VTQYTAITFISLPDFQVARDSLQTVIVLLRQQRKTSTGGFFELFKTTPLQPPLSPTQLPPPWHKHIHQKRSPFLLQVFKFVYLESASRKTNLRSDDSVFEAFETRPYIYLPLQLNLLNLDTSAKRFHQVSSLRFFFKSSFTFKTYFTGAISQVSHIEFFRSATRHTYIFFDATSQQHLSTS
jgi:hypothetical protein